MTVYDICCIIIAVKFVGGLGSERYSRNDFGNNNRIQTTTTMKKILIIEDDKTLAQQIHEALSASGKYDVKAITKETSRYSNIIAEIEKAEIVLLDNNLDGFGNYDICGLSFLPHCREKVLVGISSTFHPQYGMNQWLDKMDLLKGGDSAKGAVTFLFEVLDRAIAS